jgi:hypothetical protein
MFTHPGGFDQSVLLWGHCFGVLQSHIAPKFSVHPYFASNSYTVLCPPPSSPRNTPRASRSLMSRRAASAGHLPMVVSLLRPLSPTPLHSD